jgi:hypothetical protein
VLGQRVVGRAGDRELLVGEIPLLPCERQRLERLRRGTEERDEPRVAGLLDDPAVADGDRVDEVLGLDGASTLDHYSDRVGHETRP